MLECDHSWLIMEMTVTLGFKFVPLKFKVDHVNIGKTMPDTMWT